VEQNFSIVIQDLSNLAGSYRSLLSQVQEERLNLNIPTLKLDQIYSARVDDESLIPYKAREGTLGSLISEKIRDMGENERFDFSRLQSLQSRTPQLSDYMSEELSSRKEIALSRLELPQKLDLRLSEFTSQFKGFEIAQFVPPEYKSEFSFPVSEIRPRVLEPEYTSKDYDEKIAFAEQEKGSKISWPDFGIQKVVQEIKQASYAVYDQKEHRPIELEEREEKEKEAKWANF
jgi:hypothetical protein